MNVFVASFLLGIASVTVYKTNICYHVYNIALNYSNGNKHKDEFLFELASINLTEADDNFDKVARELVTAFHNVGFAYLIDNKDFDSDELLYWTQWFFNLPNDTKMKIAKNAFNTESANQYRGFFPLVPGGHSFKEAFEMGVFERDIISRNLPTKLDIRNTTVSPDGKVFMRNIVEEKNTWPITGDRESDEKFCEVMQKYNKYYGKTAKLIFQLLMHGLGFEKTKYDHLFGTKMLTTFRLLHYPTRLNNPESIPADAWDNNQAIVTGEHFDSTMLTILATFSYNGLQIKPKGSTEWIDVRADKSKLVVNIGAMLSHMTDGNLIATNHRVLDVGVDRYSVPLFFEPCFDADMSKTFHGAKNTLVGNFTKYGPWMTNRTSMFVEYATTDFGVID